MWSDIYVWFCFSLPWWLVTLSIFHIPVGHFMLPLEKCLYSYSIHFLISFLVFFLPLSCRSSNIFWRLTSCQIMVCKYFLPFYSLPFAMLFLFLCRSILVWCIRNLFLLLSVFWCHIFEITAKTSVMKLFPCVFF